MYNLIEYSNDYSETTIGLWHYYRDKRALDNNNNNSIVDFPNNNNNNNNNKSISFKSKETITWQTENDSTKDVDIMLTLKYLSSFWRTLEMP